MAALELFQTKSAIPKFFKYPFRQSKHFSKMDVFERLRNGEKLWLIIDSSQRYSA
ncbi:MAG: hypothetical protein GX930_03480 [Clostridia bacterium]|jgi:hypothetical protein|nr:hypothetical protein [Clostridia bacterium]